MATIPLWLDDEGPWRAPAPSGGGGAGGPFDVEIVGAGVTGLACAALLAAAGRRVRVHDERGMGGGASGRNAGFALRGAAMPYDVARQELGAARARGLWAATDAALDHMEALAGDALRRVGSLRIPVSGEEEARVRAELDALVEDGFTGEWVAPAAPGGLGMVRNPGDGALQPLRWIRRLAGGAARAGARLAEGSRVDSLAALEAPVVVVATDGYGGGLLPALDGTVRPARGQVLATTPLARRVAPCPCYARDGYEYWQQLPDGRLVLGGFRDRSPHSEGTCEDDVTPTVQGRLEVLASAIAQGEPIEVTHRWSGAWGETPDRLPLVGALGAATAGRGGVWVAAGYSGHGNVLGLACGEVVARAILGAPAPGDEVLLDVFSPGRPALGL